MKLPLTTSETNWGTNRIKIYLPESTALKQYWQNHGSPDKQFPYWAKIWPSAIGLCQFLFKQPHLIKDKNVTELAAGLGLPSLLASLVATSVRCSDLAADAIAVVQQSIDLNKFENITCQQLDWRVMPPPNAEEVILLSDVNYEPQVFDELLSLIQKWLQSGCTIILSTPQRLVAKPFIEQLLPFAKTQTEEVVHEESNDTRVSVLVLRN